ncbi:MAG: hypothetical protein V7L20_30915 [Nostoc sp.]
MGYWFRYIELSTSYLPVNATVLWAASFGKDWRSLGSFPQYAR